MLRALYRVIDHFATRHGKCDECAKLQGISKFAGTDGMRGATYERSPCFLVRQEACFSDVGSEADDLSAFVERNQILGYETRAR